LVGGFVVLGFGTCYESCCVLIVFLRIAVYRLGKIRLANLIISNNLHRKR
jgi:hypothetical protein